MDFSFVHLTSVLCQPCNLLMTRNLTENIAFEYIYFMLISVPLKKKHFEYKMQPTLHETDESITESSDFHCLFYNSLLIDQ